MEGTRLTILTLLQRQNQATVDDLSRQLGLASATVRRHLDILQRDHLVSFKEVRKKTGRPEYSFSLTEEGQESLPKGYLRLLGDLVQEIGSLTKKDIENTGNANLSEVLFTRLAQRTAAQHTNGGRENSVEERVELLQRALTEWGFLPNVERSDGKIRIRLVNCAFRNVALSQKAVCAFDQAVVKSILGAEVTKETSLQRGDPCCCYVLNAAEK